MGVIIGFVACLLVQHVYEIRQESSLFCVQQASHFFENNLIGNDRVTRQPRLVCREKTHREKHQTRLQVDAVCEHEACGDRKAPF